MTERDLLDDLFAEARAEPIAPSAGFMSRVLADAETHQPPPREVVRAVAPTGSPGLWARLLSALGGAAAVAGISSAAMAGLVIGYVQPDALVTIADSYGFAAGSGESLDLLPQYYSLLSEEQVE